MPGHCFKDEEWKRLYPLLRTRIARWVCTSYSPSWTRQRHDVIEDIVGETIVKVVAYAQQAALGTVREIDSLEKIATVAAYHCYVDALRRDQRLQPLLPDFEEPTGWSSNKVDVDPMEQAIDNVHCELIFAHAARWIVKFPDKQRTALLVDLASRMYFDPFESTPLQEAFALVGIDIRSYNRPLPSATKERANHSTHLSLAYKRLALLAYMQRYTFVA